jgi:osmoprotectant transport system substrate-binding protein
MRRHRKLALGAALLSFALLAVACGDDEPGGGGTTEPTATEPTATEPMERGTLVVGVSGAFPENQVVAEMYAQVLENAGYTVERQLELGTREISDRALFSGEIQLKPEYTGFEIPALDPDATVGTDPEQVHQDLVDLYAEEGIVTLDFSPANSTNAFVVLPETAEEHGLETVSDLEPVADQLSLGGPPECPDREFCLIGLEEVYGIEEFAEFRSLDFGGAQTEQALATGAIDVALLFSLNPNIEKNGWVLLEDDKQLQVPGNFVGVIREDATNDEIEGLINDVTASLTTEGMLDLVNRIVNDRQDTAAVARSHLEAEGLFA